MPVTLALGDGGKRIVLSSDQAGLHSEFQRHILRLISRMERGVGENLLSSSRNCPANKNE